MTKLHKLADILVISMISFHLFSSCLAEWCWWTLEYYKYWWFYLLSRYLSMQSIRKSECPKELEPADRRSSVHVNLIRRDENCPVIKSTSNFLISSKYVNIWRILLAFAKIVSQRSFIFLFNWLYWVPIWWPGIWDYWEVEFVRQQTFYRFGLI